MKGLPRMTAHPEIHRAEWVVPVSAPPLPNGAVLAQGGRVVAAGPFSAVRKDCPAGARFVDHGRTAIFPALVNAHTHLELSTLKGKIPFPQPGFRQWISLLFAARASAGARMEPGSIPEGLHRGETELLSSGTVFCADITNGAAAVQSGPAAVLERQIFLEILGFNLKSVAAAIPPGIKVIDPGEKPRDKASIYAPSPSASGANGVCAIPVPHSVYSVSPTIIAESKEWTRERGLPFSIHTAEHLDEIEFLQTGKGFCRELLMGMGRWEPEWKPPGKTPVEYLDRLGALDFRTLMVHSVHMSETDWELAAKRHCTPVFCPRSNRNMGSGSPQIEKALSLGMNCALATDSLASNTDLDLFAEAAFVLDNHPSIDPQRVLEMMTVNPARSLGRKSDFGHIGPGAKDHMLAVCIPSGVSGSNLAEALIQSGKEGAWEWVSRAQS